MSVRKLSNRFQALNNAMKKASLNAIDSHELFKILDADPQFGGEQGHQVDLFAAEGNTQLDRFFSRFWCRRAEAADAFAQDWLGLNGWANPPRVLIPRVVAHARMCECSCTLIVRSRT